MLFLLGSFALPTAAAVAQAQPSDTPAAKPVPSLEEVSDEDLARRIVELSDQAEGLMAEIARLRAELRRRAGDAGAAEVLATAAAQATEEGTTEGEQAAQEPAERASAPREPVDDGEPVAEARAAPSPAPVLPRRLPDPTERASRPPATPETEEDADADLEEAARRAAARRRAAQAECVFLQPLDWREDGVIDAGDRYWRYLYLWNDTDGDDRVAEREVRSVFEAGVRSIDVRLDRFGLEGDGVGVMAVRRGRVVLDVDGNGFGTPADGVLTVDADALGRGTGPRLLDADGSELTGLQALREGLQIRLSEGEVVALGCD